MNNNLRLNINEYFLFLFCFFKATFKKLSKNLQGLNTFFFFYKMYTSVSILQINPPTSKLVTYKNE